MTYREYIAQYPQLAADPCLGDTVRDCLPDYDPDRDWDGDECTPDGQFLFDCLAMADVVRAHVTAVHGRFRPAVNECFPKEEPCCKDIRLACGKAVADISKYRSANGLCVPDGGIQDAVCHTLARYVCRLIPTI